MADAVMSLDNVVAIAAIAREDVRLDLVVAAQVAHHRTTGAGAAIAGADHGNALRPEEIHHSFAVDGHHLALASQPLPDAKQRIGGAESARLGHEPDQPIGDRETGAGDSGQQFASDIQR